MRRLETFFAATPLLFACASAPQRKPAEVQPTVQPVAQHINAPICAKLSSGEAVDFPIWPEALGGTVDEVRDACAEVMNDPEFCPNATSVGLSRTASLYPGILPPSLAQEAKDSCLRVLEPKGKGGKCTPRGGFGMHMTM